MANYSIPSAKTVYKTSYESFVGADFASDDINVSKNYFADCRNIMLDDCGYPEKRYGFKALNTALNGEVHSMKEVEVGNEKFLAIHIGDKIYKYFNNSLTPIYGYDYQKFSEVFTIPENTSRSRISIAADEYSLLPFEAKDAVVALVPSGVSSSAFKKVLDELEYFENSVSVTVAGREYTVTNLVKNGNFASGTNEFSITGNGVEVYDGYILLGKDNKPYHCAEQFLRLGAKETYYVSVKAKLADIVGKSVRVDNFNSKDEVLSTLWLPFAQCPLKKTTIPGNCRSDIFCSKNRIWVISENGVFVYDGLNFGNAEQIAHIPVTSALRNYHTVRHRDNESTEWESEKYIDPGGFVECVNLLTKKRINTFALDDFVTRYNSKTYVATSTLYIDAEISKLIKVEFLNEDGGWRDVTSYASWQRNKVQFSSEGLDVAPYITEMPIENVRVTFVADMDDDDKVNGCCFGTFYGEGDDSRLFISGNKKYPNYEWYSEYNDLTYFPDLNYCVVGSESPVVGFSKIGESLVIFKEKSPDDSAVYMQTSDFTSEGKGYFVLKQCYSEVGALDSKGIAQMSGLPHFVTDEGIFAIVNNSMTSEKSVINISFFADNLLKNEKLEDAVLYRYDGLLFCGCGDRCYVFNNNGTPYNAFIWDGIPATHFAEFDNNLYFGTADGRICVFVKEGGVERFNDYPVYGGDARAVVAYFTTKLDTDGSFMSLKTMVKRGCGIMIKPYAQSSVKVYTLTESEHERLIKQEGAAIFDFSPLYFDIVDFSTRDTARILPFNTKVKKYCALQFKVVNDSLNQGFGVYGIEKRYTVGNFKKY